MAVGFIRTRTKERCACQNRQFTPLELCFGQIVLGTDDRTAWEFTGGACKTNPTPALNTTKIAPKILKTAVFSVVSVFYPMNMGASSYKNSSIKK